MVSAGLRTSSMKGPQDLQSEEGGSSAFPWLPIGIPGVACGELERIDKCQSRAASDSVAKSAACAGRLWADACRIEIENGTDRRQVHFVEQTVHRALHESHVFGSLP